MIPDISGFQEKKGTVDIIYLHKKSNQILQIVSV
jgi:hypothetical protein